jgi:hypothetical protein
METYLEMYEKFYEIALSVGVPIKLEIAGSLNVVRVPAEAGNFPLHHRVQTGSGAHPVSYPMGTVGSFPGVKRAGREADHSPPYSADVNNA